MRFMFPWGEAPVLRYHWLSSSAGSCQVATFHCKLGPVYMEVWGFLSFASILAVNWRRYYPNSDIEASVQRSASSAGFCVILFGFCIVCP